MKRGYWLIIWLVSLLLGACRAPEKQVVIGVSQCSEDIWRTKLNAELQAAAHFYGNVEARFASADDDSERQIAQIGQFVADGVDLLIVSPNQVNTITPAVEAAFDAGIPVILFDRKIDSDKYTAFIGADNVEIGRILGNYAANVLGGKGRIVEIQGLEGSSPAIDRHNGFAEALEAYPGISVVASRYGGWLQEGGTRAMQAFLDEGVAFDAVFAQNDRMARGAYEVLPDPAGIPFFGIDALADGIQDVIDGVLTATYLYPTSGDQVMEIAMHILSGEPFDRDNRLESILVDGKNARMQLIQDQVTARQLAMVGELNDKQDEFLSRINAQRLVLWLMLALFALLIIGTALVVRSYFVTRKLSQQLEESTKAKLEFFTSVSHDLRTPLSLVSAPLDRVMSDELKPAQKQTLQVVRRNVDVLLRLVNNILDFRKIESGAFPLTLSRFDLCAAVREWMGGFEEATRNKELRFIGPDSLEVEADMHLMERTLFNLLSNAFKHTEDGAHIQVRVAEADADVILSVEDDGSGIDADFLPKIFEQFSQGRSESSGTGIGLALVRSIAQLHGGSVDVQSEKGHGSTFSIRIPRKGNGKVVESAWDASAFTEHYSVMYSRGDTAQQEAAERATEADADKPTVLVVDDNEDIRDFVESILEADYRILTAADGQQALDKATRELPDLVVCDVMMPVMDGLAFCKALKEQLATSHIPVILLTAKSLDEQRAEGYDSGADAYISKPFSEKVLLSRIGNLLKSRAQLKEHYLETGESAAAPKESDFLSRFRKLVRAHLSDPELSVEWMGSELGLSRVQLYRKTKALTGYSPVELVRITRLKEAEKLLKTSEHTVAEIAYEVGFSSPSYFSKCYRELFGSLPTEAR